jgi:UDP-3-O-[3-hydroxymyristoyl] glucosamine N-acyltransferase
LKLIEIINWHESNGFVAQNFGLDVNHEINLPRAIELCDEFNISMITGKYRDDVKQLLAGTECKLIIMPESFLNQELNVKGKAFLFHDNPKSILIDYCRKFLGYENANSNTEIHPTAVIEPGAVLGNCVKLGAHVFVDATSAIGNNCTVLANTVISNSSVGNNVKIGSNNTIGGYGFGYNKLDSGEIELFPHYGRVVIKDNVEIGNNTCIDRGSLSDTIIETGVKIDNLVHIAHNVVIGENTLIIACSMIAGSVVIGANSWVAPAGTIRNAVKLGKNSTVGLGSVVTKNVADNETVIGNPAMSMKDFLILREQQKEIIADHKKGSEER